MCDIRQAARLQAEFPGWHVPAGKVLWRVFPESVREDESDSWLVSTATEHARTAMVALRTASVLSKFEARFKRPKARIRLMVSRGEEGQPLGPAFEGVRAQVTLAPDNPLLSRTKVQTLFYLALVLAVGGTMFGAYLLWRDFEREFRLADLQSQFVASVSHELKTPLTAIRMFAETMQMGRARGRETESEYLETIVSECERLSRLVDDVLQFSKMERGHKVYRFRPSDLASVVDSACRAMQYPVREQGIDLRTSIAEDMPPVRADRDALEQAILNLLSNALKYSGNSRLIEVELEREEREAAIRVTDHGVGIPAEEQERIFERFYRVQTTENQRIPGTGIGLALVEHTAKAHGGRVEVRSAPGQGSAFTIYLPLEGADEHDSRS